jgi:beta-lactamase regulating signal transducer with metallopeptidase domain
MLSALLDHLWQSTVVALGVVLLAAVFRKASASVRFGLWFAASLKFLIPFSALSAIGRWLAPAMLLPASPEIVFIQQAAQPFSAVQVSAPAVAAAHPFNPAPVLLAVWALGACAILAVLAVRWAGVHAVVRKAAPVAWRAPMPVMASASMMEPGLVGFWRPVLLVPETLTDHLSPVEIDAIVAHESCHLRRHDNLTAAVHMLVEALFWFHPMVWWIGARMVEERELACDEAVVRSGHDRATYARSLVESCRLYLRSPLPFVSGASGSKLKNRVRMIMTAAPSAPLSAGGRALLAAAGLCALATPVCAGLLTSPAGEQAAARAAAIVTAYAPAPIQDPAASQASQASRALQPSPAQAEAAANPSPQPIAARGRQSPATEAAVRRWLLALQAHQADEEDMTPAMQAAARKQALYAMQVVRAFGALQDVRFVQVTPAGEDAYEVDFAHGKMQVLAAPLTADGKLDQLR